MFQFERYPKSGHEPETDYILVEFEERGPRAAREIAKFKGGEFRPHLNPRRVQG